MDLEETMVDEQLDTGAADDALLENDAEETDESESLDALTESEQDEPAEEKSDEAPKGTTEPGWIRKRVDKAVSKAVAETEARMNAMFEQQMAPLREKMMEDEANKLIGDGKVKDFQTAMELVRYRHGLPSAIKADSEQPQQPRNQNGQFASKDDAAINVRINMLKHQADRIRESGGPDVISEFQNNKEINKKVKAGEMDFYDVAEQMKQPAKKKPPSPMRSPNGASGQNNPNAIDSMSDEQFKRLEKRLQEGARYKLS